MLNNLFFIILRSVAIPAVAFYLLKSTALGEEGALLAVGLALLVTNGLSIAGNMIKIFGNAVLLRPQAVSKLLIIIGIQFISVAFIWIYYFANYV